MIDKTFCVVSQCWTLMLIPLKCYNAKSATVSVPTHPTPPPPPPHHHHHHHHHHHQNSWLFLPCPPTSIALHCRLLEARFLRKNKREIARICVNICKFLLSNFMAAYRSLAIPREKCINIDGLKGTSCVHP